VGSLIPGPYTLDGSSCSGLSPSAPGYVLSYVGVTHGFVVSAASPCGPGLQAHVLMATSRRGNFTGLFCVNAKGVGTYTPGNGARHGEHHGLARNDLDHRLREEPGSVGDQDRQVQHVR